MINVSFWLRKNPKNPQTATIYYYVTCAGARNKTPQSTRQRIYTSDWDAVTQRTKNDIVNQVLDDIVYRIRAVAARHLSENIALHPESVLQEYLASLTRIPYISLLALAEQYISNKKAEFMAGRVVKRTYETYLTRLTTLRQFLTANKLEQTGADAVGYRHIQQFYEWMAITCKLSNDYVCKNIQFLRQVYSFGQLNELCKSNPTKAFRLSFDYNNRRHFDYLDKAEIDKLRNYAFAAQPLATARDLFLFQIYTGFAYADMAAFDPKQHILRNGNKLFICKPRQKTDVPAMVPLYPTAKAILDKYNQQLPVFAQQYYNRLLGEISGILCFRIKLSSHVARRTAAMMWLNSGIRLEVVSRMLGHASTLITQKRYAKLSAETIWREAANFETF